VTLDNPQNPVLCLRAALPAGLLRRSGAIAFAPGATLSLEDLAAAAREAGFRVERAGFLLFAPRLPVLVALRLAARLGLEPSSHRVLRWLSALERLGRALAPRRTAQYVAVRLHKPDDPGAGYTPEDQRPDGPSHEGSRN
jgi:hypothetical protein